MEIKEHLSALQDAGVRLAAAAERAGVDAPVPTCPGWRVRDLLEHLGGVHRWAAAYVATGRTEPFTDEEAAVFFTAPDDAGLVGWYREGHTALVRTLREADPGTTCWAFLRAPSPLAFWARRQAHETAIHMIDAEAAAAAASPGDAGGIAPSTAASPGDADGIASPRDAAPGTGGSASTARAIASFTPAFAADGVDELFDGFLPRRRGRLVADPPVSLAVRATDHPTAWTVRVEPGGRAVTPGADAADCVVSGPARELYLMLWNRGGAEALDVRGDRSVLELWREKSVIVWS
ncbi:maleylpyruvate isomerase N-terminal domain-containing protein [Planobispora takensis]|uniref:Maleylpyruvate isomerase family mycothiol-dependent enzyme n=1 Tax=Planobispora takensis TaxID=1367882 RepID=A0A8J3SV74_9ACTN|nr:maleylpyruvate isomerase N-terminal domain-containing protein [Planobispora takensis]GII00823.1 hypothetical protein Pta02_28310 [Planobispora takensis]